MLSLLGIAAAVFAWKAAAASELDSRHRQGQGQGQGTGNRHREKDGGAGAAAGAAVAVVAADVAGDEWSEVRLDIEMVEKEKEKADSSRGK